MLEVRGITKIFAQHTPNEKVATEVASERASRRNAGNVSAQRRLRHGWPIRATG